MKNPVRYIIQFVLLMLVQVLLLNDVVVKSSITFFQIPIFTPMIYFLFILMLPVGQAVWISMLWAMLTGFLMDIFSNTPGLHAMVCVLLAYVRPSFLKLFLQQNLNEIADTVPTLYKMGFRSYLLYILFAVIIHHGVYYLMQEWSIRNFHIVLLKTLLSGIISLLLIFIVQLIFVQQSTRRKA
jgi:rod shape-determining protein MreD